MYKMILFPLALCFFFVQYVFATDCGKSQKVKVGSSEVEFFRIEDTPESRTGVKPKMLVSGIYQFVHKGSKWDVYRCAKPYSNPPVYDANNCELKNDFQFGSIVAKSKQGQSLQKVSKRGANVLGVHMPYATELSEFKVSFNDDGIEVVEEGTETVRNSNGWDKNHINRTVVSCKYSEGKYSESSRTSAAPAQRSSSKSNAAGVGQ